MCFALFRSSYLLTSKEQSYLLSINPWEYISSNKYGLLEEELGLLIVMHSPLPEIPFP